MTVRFPVDNRIEEPIAPAKVEQSEGFVVSAIKSRTITMVCTGYCSCYKCCGKHPSNKAYGITASRAKVSNITVAADTNVLPFGTHIVIPGIGERIVQDRGGAIKGNKLDIWFSSHEQAKNFGRKYLEVEVLN